MNAKFSLGLLLFSLGSILWLSPLKSSPTQTQNSAKIKQWNDLHAGTDNNKKRPLILKSTFSGQEESVSADETNLNLIDNWDLSEINLAPEALAPFFAESQPARIVYHDITGTKQIFPKHYAAGNAQSDKTLFLSSLEWVQETARLRQALSDSSAFPSEDKNETDTMLHLPNNSYDIHMDAPGTSADGSIFVAAAVDHRRALNGPDYSFANIPPGDTEKMTELLQTVLPLGNNGLLVLQISNNGAMKTGAGTDFSVYQTTFRIEGTDLYWNKFAHLGVSNTRSSTNVKWFPCDPDAAPQNCVGAVPTEEGGDQFNIAEVGLSEARYIWIKDTGNNFDLRSKWPTEGCALDALRIYHAYITK